MEGPRGRLFLVAGEPSGDTHAAHVAEELSARCPELLLEGLGGPHMAAAGVRLREDLASRAVMGLFPVLRALPWLRRIFRDAADHLRRSPPDALVLVDYPGFNMRLAARARELGIPVIYYISPQVWAWARWRIRRLVRLVDRMLVILPFEEEVYRDSGLSCVFVGHPLMDRLARAPRDADLGARLRGGQRPLVGLFPGSRRHVVAALLPVFLEAARRLRGLPGTEEARFAVALAQESFRDMVPSDADPSLPLEVITGNPIEIMETADLCLTSSGTSTLEIAAAGTPFVLGYRVSPLVYVLGRLLLSVEHIGLVNLVAGERVVPEFVGVRSFAAGAATELNRLWTDEQARERQLQGLAGVRERLDRPGAYARAAEEILGFLGS